MFSKLTLTLVGGSIVFLDQISKAQIQKTFLLHESLSVIPHFFSITYIRNPGAAFGLLANQSDDVRFLLFTGGSLIALAFLLRIFYQTSEEKKGQRAALAMIIGGAAGNLLDRIRMGEVIDFLDFYVGAYHWPAFNVADSAITLGVSLLLFYLLRKSPLP